MKGDWRCVKDDASNGVLPGPRGSLAVCMGRTAVFVLFETAEYTQAFHAASIRFAPNGSVHMGRNSGEVVFAPAATTRRKRLPVPPTPVIATYVDVPWATAPDGSSVRDWTQTTVHTVGSIIKPPNPNRAFNADDALVRSVCGRKIWVSPDKWNPRCGARCGECSGLPAADIPCDVTE